MKVTIGEFVKDNLESIVGLAEIYSVFTPEQYEKLFDQDYKPTIHDFRKLHKLSGNGVKWWQGVSTALRYKNGEVNGN